MAQFSCITWESGQCELYFSLYIYEAGLCFAGKRFPLRRFPYLFGHFSEVLFQWPPQCPTFSVCPLISLALSPETIDRSYRIDHLFSFVLSFFFARSLRFFNRLFSTSLSLALFYLFIRSFARAEALYRTTGDLRETRPYFAIVFRFVPLLCFWLLSFPMVTEPNTTAGLSDRRIFLLLCMRFVYSFDDCRCFERVHPFNFVHFASGMRRQRGSFLFNKADLKQGGWRYRSADL